MALWLERSGVRWHLLLAFCGISAFAVLAAAAAMYAFLRVGEALNEITEQRVPPALTSLELARRTERFLAAAPALLAVEDAGQHEVQSLRIAQELDQLAQLIDALRASDADADAVDAIDGAMGRLRASFAGLDQVVASHLPVEARRHSLLNQLPLVFSGIQRLLTPLVRLQEGKISQLRRILDAAGAGEAEDADRMGELAASIVALEAPQRALVRAAAINDALLLAASARTEADLDLVRLTLRRSIDEVAGITADLGSAIRPRVEAHFDSLRDLVEAADGVIETRRRQILILAEGDRLLAENTAISGELAEAVGTLVAAARQDIDAASREALAVQDVSTKVLLAVIAASLISAVLIVLLYVDRNLVRRLTVLSDRTMAIAGGNLDVEIPAGGRDEIGRMAEALAIFRATAAEMKASNLREILKARQRLTHAIESISEGFSLYDAADRLVLSNSRYSELLYPGMADVMVPGTPFETILRRAFERGLIMDTEGGGDIESWIARRLERHRNPAGPHLQQRQGGRWIQVSERRTEDGGTVAVYTDLTDLKRTEEELRQAKEAAEQANRSKSQFLANMSHELRTPLNAVIGIAEILIEDAQALGEEKDSEPLQRIHRAGNHLLALINDILDLSKIEAGKMELLLAEVDIAALLRDVATTVEPLAARNGNRLTLRCPEGIPPLWADPTRVRQIALNLIGNSCKFTEQGEVEVRVESAGVTGDGRVVVEVRDTGIGMSEEQMARLFEDFTQVDSSTTRKHGGTGLGLAISRRFARMMGGDITVESAPGAGSTFRLSLPRAPAPAIRQRAEPRSPPAAPATGRILVIDDDPTALGLVADALKREGFAAITARGGAEGLRAARAEPPAAILLDLLMPEMDGWEVLAALKDDPRLAEVPVIMLTILDEDARAFMLGAADFLLKPVSRERLVAVLARHCAPRARILLVEDQADARAHIRDLVERSGFAVAEAANGRQALERLAAGSFDLILLDLLMPEMDGFAFLAELRASRAWSGLPVVVLTGKDLTLEDHARLNGKVSAVMDKGAVGRAQILAAVRRALGAAAPDGAAGT
jgi:signal transduction histidine kinase/DNA-binding response OmpR family regulator/HAMP domain-containing protein